ncbi:MAG: tetratricopeptide repeat protein [Leptospiraceae bacterium]|nr:tetratricopeptide repeat protein [Leptospiraceae bacterium]
MKYLLLIFFLTTSLFSQSYKAYLDKANNHLSKKEYSQAIEELKVAVTKTSNKEDLAQIHFTIGYVYNSINEPKKAIEYYEKSLGYNENYLSSLENLGSLYTLYKDLDFQFFKALRYLAKAESLNSSNANVYYNLACICSQKKELDKAILYLDMAIYYHLGNLETLSEDTDLENIRNTEYYKRLMDHLDSLEKAKKAFSTAREVEKKSEYTLAIQKYEEAIQEFAVSLGQENLWIANCYNNIGEAYRENGDYNKAINYYNQSLAIFTKLLDNNHSLIATSYNSFGMAYGHKGEHNKAIEYFNKAVAIYKKTLGEKHSYIAVAYNNIGGAYSNKHDYNKAINYYQKALSIFSKAHKENHFYVAICYNNIGEAYREKGEYNNALEYYHKALPIFIKELGEKHPYTATCYNNLGLTYDSKGEYKKALEYYTKSLTLRLEVVGDNHPDVALSYNNIGLVYDHKAEYDKAIEYYQKASDILCKSGNRDTKLLVFSNLSKVYEKANNIPMAIETLNITVDVILKSRLEIGREKSEFTSRHINKFDRLIRLYLQQGDYNSAFVVDSLSRGLSITEGLNLKSALIKSGVSQTDRERILNKYGELYSMNSEKEVALSQNKIKKIESLTPKIWQIEKEIQYIEDEFQAKYTRYKELKETGKISVQEIQKSLKEDEAILSYNLSSIKPVVFVIRKTGELQFHELNIKRGKLIKDVNSFYTLTANDVEKKSLIKIKLDKGGEMIWDGNASKYEMDDDMENIYAWEKEKDEKQQIKDFHNQVEPGYQRVKVGKFLEELSLKDAKELREKLSKELYLYLIQPVIPKLKGTKRVVVVPDEVLYYLPFNLLKNEQGQSLEKNLEIKLIHSAAVWLQLRKNDPGLSQRHNNELLSIGNAVYDKDYNKEVRSGKRNRKVKYVRIMRSKRKGSDNTVLQERMTESEYLRKNRNDEFNNLPGTEEEVQTIAKLVYSQDSEIEQNIKLGIHANEDDLLDLNERKELEKYRILHFAVHGVFEDRNVEENALVLTIPSKAKEYPEYKKEAEKLKEDGFLRLGEVKSLYLKSELVVMSACETSLGYESGGEGMVGLPQAFLIAGSRKVIASLWPVDDKATSLFMQVMYKALIKEKLSPKEALHKAREVVKNTPGYEEPMYWSGFVLYEE